ncbi:MAG: hypothetical protein K2R98_27280, partial [Gemmataceae bacterium]|nr:hypothetical protein [Gemmataceae bacterium]
GGYTVTVAATDGKGGSASVTFNWTVVAVPASTIGREDNYVPHKAAPLKVDADHGILANDSTSENGALTAQLVDGVDHGTLRLNPDGSFIYEATEGYSGLDSFIYQAVGSNGARSEDTRVQLFVQGQDKEPVTTPQMGNSGKDAKGGVLQWKIQANENKSLGNAVLAVFDYVPSKDNPCKNITFLQIVQSTIAKKPNFPTDDDGKSLADYFKQYSTKSGWFLDHDPLSQGTQPYFGAVWDAKAKKWASGSEEKEGAPLLLGNGPEKKIARMADLPMDDEGRKGRGVVAYKFETAVFCIDTQEVLGVITCGFTIPDDPKKAIELDKVQFKLGVSDDFREAVQNANDVQGKKIKVGDKEFTLNAMLHAQLDGSAKLTGAAVLPKKK